MSTKIRALQTRRGLRDTTRARRMKATGRPGHSTSAGHTAKSTLEDVTGLVCESELEDLVAALVRYVEACQLATRPASQALTRPMFLGSRSRPFFSLRRGRTPTRAKHMCLATTPLQCTQECSEFEVFLLKCCLCLLWSLLREAPCGRLLMSHALCLPSAQRRRDDGLRSFWRTNSTS